jgi:hypothetical protein
MQVYGAFIPATFNSSHCRSGDVFSPKFSRPDRRPTDSHPTLARDQGILQRLLSIDFRQEIDESAETLLPI